MITMCTVSFFQHPYLWQIRVVRFGFRSSRDFVT